MTKNKNSFNSSAIKYVLAALVGSVICITLIFKFMPSMMIVTSKSNFDFDTTVAMLENSVIDNGWVISGGNAIDMNNSLMQNGVDFTPRVKLIKLCKANYAQSVLETDRYISCMMPCTISIWEDDNGAVNISKMNMGLMAKIFGGNISRVMGKDVAEDEKMILSVVLGQ